MIDSVEFVESLNIISRGSVTFHRGIKAYLIFARIHWNFAICFLNLTFSITNDQKKF